MNRVPAVVRLHLSRRFSSIWLPAILAVGVVAVMIVIATAMRLAGVDMTAPETVQGMRYNQVITYTLGGFFVALGVQAATSCFSFAIALGTTRRHYVLGSGAYFLLEAVYVTALLTVLLLVEKATNHWFLDAYVFDTVLLGDGEPLRFALFVFVGALATQTIGATFGSSWLRFGARGPLIIGAALVVVVVAGILVVVPRLDQWAQYFTSTLALVVLGVVTVVSLASANAFLRSASPRAA